MVLTELPFLVPLAILSSYQETTMPSKSIYRFYVYAYLREDETPYYIGKGQGNRAYVKHKNYSNPPSDLSRIIFLETNLSEEDAFLLERQYIAKFGRKDNGTGILRNMTDGGEGMSGFKHTEETKEKLKNNSQKMISDGTHPFLKRNDGSSVGSDMAIDGMLHFQKNPIKAKDLCVEYNIKRVLDGTHNFLNKESAKINSEKRVLDGTHNFLGKGVVTLIDKNGIGHRLDISILDYWKKSGLPMSEWEYVAIASKEAKLRKLTSQH